jgi:hypothetical protein
VDLHDFDLGIVVRPNPGILSKKGNGPRDKVDAPGLSIRIPTSRSLVLLERYCDKVGAVESPGVPSFRKRIALSSASVDC